MAKILIVEDEKMINELITKNLSTVGHHCVQVYDGQTALDQMESGSFDLVILDVMLPVLNGFEVMERIEASKHLSQVPVIFLTAMGNVLDKVRGLGLGAEDYMVKPFEMLELLARVEAILRRRHRELRIFELDGVTVNLDTLNVTRDGRQVDLTPQEYQLLAVLIRNRNIALSREKLLDLAWGMDYYGDTRTVDVHIQKLRKKLGWAERIRTVYKLGYRLEVTP